MLKQYFKISRADGSRFEPSGQPHYDHIIYCNGTYEYIQVDLLQKTILPKTWFDLGYSIKRFIGEGKWIQESIAPRIKHSNQYVVWGPKNKSWLEVQGDKVVMVCPETGKIEHCSAMKLNSVVEHIKSGVWTQVSPFEEPFFFSGYKPAPALPIPPPKRPTSEDLFATL